MQDLDVPMCEKIHNLDFIYKGNHQNAHFFLVQMPSNQQAFGFKYLDINFKYSFTSTLITFKH